MFHPIPAPTHDGPPAREPPAALVGAKIDILVVDDSPRNLVALEAMLESLGQSIVTARSGADALRHLLERDFALVLLDIQMPGLDGLETAQIIRARERSRNLPIIFMTAYTKDDTQVSQAYEIGAVDFLFKPIAPFILRAKIQVFVDLYRKTLELERHAGLLRESQQREHVRAQAEATQRWEAERLGQQVLQERASAVVLARTVAEREHAEAALQLSHRRLGVLSDVAVRLLVGDHPKDVVDAILKQLAEHLGLEMYLHYVSADGGQSLALEASGGIEFGAARDLLATETDAVASAVATSGQRVIAEHVQASGDLTLAAARAAGLGAYACFPLVAQGRLLGTLSYGTRLRPAFEADEVAVMQVVCDQVAIALERARLIAELSLRNREFAEADRMKDEFLAMLAHELRNPMAPILNAVEVLRMPGVPPPATVRALDAVDRQARHMVRLLDDLLDVSRIKSGKIALTRAPVTLASIVSHAVQACAPLMGQGEHRFESRLPVGEITLHADATRLCQVFANLLENAAKYSPPRTTIALVADVEGDEVVIRVCDEGFGLERGLLEHVFGLFVQSHRTADRTQGGLGIGLTVVRSLVELHGGSVSASSAGLGKGSEFVVRLPFAAEAQVLQPPPQAPAPTVERPKPRRVLVVEDNEDISMTMRDLLEYWGHEVTLAGDGPSGVEAVLSQEPDIAFIDIGLPGLDGYQVAASLRSRAPESKTRLVALTGYGRPEDRQRALAAGFDQHVVKPVTSEELRALVEASEVPN
ncbi:MAG: response regulator [Myxococcales bacterium]|nr:response regulator [Myxococcales bacterium]